MEVGQQILLVDVVTFMEPDSCVANVKAARIYFSC